MDEEQAERQKDTYTKEADKEQIIIETRESKDE